MAKFEKHHSLEAAERVIKALKIMLRDVKVTIEIEAWSNGREQGYCLRASSTNKSMHAMWFNIAEQRNSDAYLVIPSQEYPDLQTNMPSDAAWEQSRTFIKPTQAAAWIADLINASTLTSDKGVTK